MTMVQPHWTLQLAEWFAADTGRWLVLLIALASVRGGSLVKITQSRKTTHRTGA
jgi:hypothetical protein